MENTMKEKSAFAGTGILANPVPQRLQILSGSALKLIAVISMIIDHSAIAFVPRDAYVLLSLFGREITLYYVMRVIGRLAFPIFAFLIAEGAHYTKDRVRYGLNLFVFALISEIPWNLLFYGSVWNYEHQNIYFTLLLGYLAICFYEKFQGRFALQALSAFGLLAVSMVLGANGGPRAFVFIVLVYALRQQTILQALLAFSGLLSTWLCGFAYVPIMLYNGKRGFIRGKVLKYAFYAVYPLHLLVLYGLKEYVFTK